MNLTNKIDNMEILNRKMIVKLFLVIFAVTMSLMVSLETNAADKDISIKALVFDDHTGMMSVIDNEYVYCFGRGKTFRSSVSDLQMVTSTFEKDGKKVNGTIADNLRELLTMDADDVTNYKYFRCWGTATLNSDHTNATPIASSDSDSSVPSSDAWLEAYTEFGEDTEDDSYNNRYTANETDKSFFVIKTKLTGHENAKAKYATKMTEISLKETGFDESQYYALGMIYYYCWEDPDSDAYSDETRYKAKQAMVWAVQNGFITTIGGKGSDLRLIYQDSTGKYGKSGSSTYTGSCDGYIKTTIGKDYEAMKLYRQVVWKTTNMRVIPSFAGKTTDEAPTIKLYWDEEKNAYTTTVSDANGVLNYFNFNALDGNGNAIEGITIENNGDGTLTITSQNAYDGEITINSDASKLEPEKGEFKLPTFYKWSLQGTTVTFKFTALARDYDGTEKKNYYIPMTTNQGETSPTRTTHNGIPYKHSFDYSPMCNWFCTTNKNKVTHCRFGDDDYEWWNDCTGILNDGWTATGHNSNCPTNDQGDITCSTKHGKYTTHSHTKDCHDCTTFEPCQHQSTCPYYLYIAIEENKSYEYYNESKPILSGDDKCDYEWCCNKAHVKMSEEEITGTYVDWQIQEGVYANGRKLIDPTYAYFKIETEAHEFPAETDTTILLVAENDEWNNMAYTSPSGEVIRHADHIRLGERYKLIYVFEYKGASKGFKIVLSSEDKPYYKYNYLARMQSPQNVKPIYNMRDTDGSGEAYTGVQLATNSGNSSYPTVPHAVLAIDKTAIRLYGSYTTGETPYPDTYFWNSGSSWNDSVYLDALTTDQFDDNYNNKSAAGFTDENGVVTGKYDGPTPTEQITTNLPDNVIRSFDVSKKDDTIDVVWTFETDYEIFSGAIVNATALIEVGSNVNTTASYYDEAYNYAEDEEWDYRKDKDDAGYDEETDMGDHNNVGGRGYFSSEYTDYNGTQSDTSINAHIIHTQNNEYLTYAVDNKVYQSDIDIYATNVVLNTGAGITQHIYYERSLNIHPLNYNLYYTIVMENPNAYIYEYKLKSHDDEKESIEPPLQTIDTSNDEYEFDVNTYIRWDVSGSLEDDESNSGYAILVDHIRGGAGRNYTYIQREIPVVLGTLTTGKSALMGMTVNPNYDKLIYEDEYKGATTYVDGQKTTTSVVLNSAKYNNNMSSGKSKIYAAMDPTNKLMQPKNITASANVPNNANDEVRSYSTSNGTTSFTIMLGDGTTRTVKDTNLKSYTQYGFKFNTGNGGNKVTFPSYRSSITFFKYSMTSYNGVAAVTGAFSGNSETQRESYYISQILFKSNYTTKYQKELEEKGANYIIEKNSDGSTNAWIDMVNENEYAIVAAGQGFELKVTVKYENTFLTQYLARYKGFDDAQSYSVGTSSYIDAQYCNISSMTGFVTNDGKSHSYINGINTIDRLASQLVTGSNVYKDLYCYMSDNPDVVYSYSGIYDTPVIFDRSISYSKDYSVTTITYTMCKSAENGVATTMQNMKFYTNQIAPDSETPGIVYNGNLPSGKHSITLWTPIVAATGFDYPSGIEDRYIGDAIEIGYTIKTTAADDSIVHIVQ